MGESITIIYFDKKSYLHKLYIGYAITALKGGALPVNVQFVDYDNVNDIIHNIHSKYIVIILSLGYYSIFERFCRGMPNDSILIACHYLPTYMGKKILTELTDVDYVIVGEYDITLPNLIQSLSDGTDISECRGLMMRSNGNIIYTGRRPQIQDLDSVGFADRDLLPKSSEIYHIFASRGCEADCTFCDRNALYKNSCDKQRFRSIKNVVAEIDMLVDRYGCRFVTFSDSTFCGSENIVSRLTELYVLLKSKEYWVQFFLNLRVEQVNKEVLDLLIQLKQVGLSRVFIGLESFNEKDLSLYNKKTSVEINKDVLKLIRSTSDLNDGYTLDFEYGFILFNPYTTVGELENNLKELCSSNIFLDTNMISSRLICNCVHPITRKIYRDGLLNVSLDSEETSKVSGFEIKYKFQDKCVQRIHEVVILCYNFLSIQLQGNITYIRNRYYHFFGFDNVLSNLDGAYYDWMLRLSDFCKELMAIIIDLEKSGLSSEKCAIEFCEKFKTEFEPIDRKLRICKQRAFIQLQKKGEAIYD